MKRLFAFTLKVLRRLQWEVKTRFPEQYDGLMNSYRQVGWLRRRMAYLHINQMIEDLDAMVETGARQGQLQPEAVSRLRVFVSDLRQEHEGQSS